LDYYAIYEFEFDWEKGKPPVGIIVSQRIHAPDWSSLTYHAMHWSHPERAWVYAPDRCSDFLGRNDNQERQRPVERGEAERITPAITGGEELPDEETIEWIFQWKGQPPRAEDSKHRWAWDS
jgi:hypothetical protein